jgi:hypothetical protein
MLTELTYRKSQRLGKTSRPPDLRGMLRGGSRWYLPHAASAVVPSHSSGLDSSLPVESLPLSRAAKPPKACP